MQRMFLTVSNFSVRETGSKKALFFIHNDSPNLSPPKYFDSSKKQNVKCNLLFSCNTLRYLQRKFEMLKIIIIKKKKIIKHENISEHVQRMVKMKMKEQKSKHHK